MRHRPFFTAGRFPFWQRGSPRRDPGTPWFRSRAQRVPRRRALAVRAVRRTWSMRSVWRAQRHETSQSCRLCSRETRRWPGVRYNYLTQELCCQLLAAVWAQNLRQMAPRGGRGRTDFSRDGRPRSPAGRLPRRSGPWGCRAAGPGRERARCVSACGGRGATHPSSPRLTGPQAVAHGALRRAPKSCQGPRASCT